MSDITDWKTTSTQFPTILCLKLPIETYLFINIDNDQHWKYQS